MGGTIEQKTRFIWIRIAVLERERERMLRTAEYSECDLGWKFSLFVAVMTSTNPVLDESTLWEQFRCWTNQRPPCTHYLISISTSLGTACHTMNVSSGPARTRRPRGFGQRAKTNIIYVGHGTGWKILGRGFFFASPIRA